MPLTTTGQLVRSAASSSSAVAAFNVITLEHVEGVIAGAEAAGRPIILQISQNAVRFHGGQLRPITRAALEAATTSAIAVALHLDHVTDPHLLQQAADAGFSSAMFDAGTAPYADNVAATRDAARWAHSTGVWLEAELGYVGGKPGTPASAHTRGVRTDPMEASRFVEETGVDALAVAVGSSHAMTSKTARLDHELIRRIAAEVIVPLVLHGSSGVGDDELRDAVSAGIRKINIGTALNIAFTGAVRRTLEAGPSIVDAREYLVAAREAVAHTTEALLHVIRP